MAVLGLGVLLAWAMLWWSRRVDRSGWIMSRAPALPVGALAEHDDAWIRGRVHSETPLECPWFGVDCVYYHYRIERKVTRRVSDGKGRTRSRTEWVTDHEEKRQQPFTLVDGDAEIVVRLPAGRLGESVKTGRDYEGFSRRHSATLLPLGRTVSVLGVRLEDHTFGPLREVPLLVVLRDRDAYLRRVEAGERWTRRFGFFFAFAGGLGSWLALQSRAGPLGLQDWSLALVIGLGVCLPIWFLSTYNKLVRTRQQSEAAWRQIDVDVTVRDDLIP